MTSLKRSLLDVFGDSLGAFRNGVPGEFSGEDKLDGGLDFPRGESSPLVEPDELGSFGGDAIEGVVDEGVHDVHGLLGDADVGVDLLEHLVDVDGEGLNSSSSGFLVGSWSSGFGRLLSHLNQIVYTLLKTLGNLQRFYPTVSSFQFDWPDLKYQLERCYQYPKASILTHAHLLIYLAVVLSISLISQHLLHLCVQKEQEDGERTGLKKGEMDNSDEIGMKSKETKKNKQTYKPTLSMICESSYYYYYYYYYIYVTSEYTNSIRIRLFVGLRNRSGPL